MECTKAKKALLKASDREIHFPLDSIYSKMLFRYGHVYDIAYQDEQGVFLRQKSQTDVSVFFNYSEVDLIAP